MHRYRENRVQDHLLAADEETKSSMRSGQVPQLVKTLIQHTGDSSIDVAAFQVVSQHR